MKKLISILCLGLFLGACTTVSTAVSTKGYGQQLDTWLGSTEDNLISQWGIPTSSYETGEHKYLKFHKNYGWTQYGEWYCDVTMTLTNGTITNWAFKGNACEAKETKEK